MSETLPRFEQQTLWDMTSATSSPALPPGASPSGSPAGQAADPSGPQAAPASPSARPASKKAKKTRGTSGRCSPASSASVSLTASLGSRLVELVDTAGSMEYELTWKRKSTPSGLRIFRLAARARHTSATGCSGWPTAAATDGTKAPPDHHGRNPTLPGAALLAGWATPRGQEDGSSLEATLARQGRARQKYEAGEYGGNSGPPSMNSLAHQALLAGWATPTSSEKVRSEEFAEGREPTVREALLSGWATPREHPVRGENPETLQARKDAGMDGGGVNLSTQALLTGWTTPCQGDILSTTGELRPSRVATGRTTDYLARQACSTTPGATSPSSPAATAGSAGMALNPGMSRWLMGIPSVWDHWSPCWSSWATTQPLLAVLSARRSEAASAG